MLKKIFSQKKDFNFLIVDKKAQVKDKNLKDWKIVKKHSDNKYMYVSNEEGFFFEETIDLISKEEGKNSAIFVYDDIKNKRILIGFSNDLDKTEVIKLNNQNTDNEKIVDKIISVLKVYSYRAHIYFIVDKKQKSKEYEFLLLYVESFFFFNGQEILSDNKLKGYLNNLTFNATLSTKIKIYFKEYGKIALLSLVWLIPLVGLNEYTKMNIMSEEIKIQEEIKQKKKERLLLQKKMLFLNKEISKKSSRYSGVDYE